MSYNSENYYALRREFEEKHLRAIERAETLKKTLWGKIDGLREIDEALSDTGARIMGAALGGKAGLDGRIAKIRQDVEALREARALLLRQNGYPADCTDVHYECENCKDTGFVDTKMCACFRRALTLRGYESSGVGKLIGRQSFDTFSLDYYKDDPQTLSRMKRNFETVRRYAETFSPRSSGSLLFMGGTGLGKTHLSSALAKAVIDRGCDVLYESAQNIFSKLENSKFHGDASSAGDAERYFSAELLILDDLGAEFCTAFSVSCLYNIINTRICRALPTVISTNLSAEELAARYGERIFSRLFGEYTPLLFCGRDIRMEKQG